VIRVAVVDDHPAVRAGLRAVIEYEPGIVFAGSCTGEDDTLWSLLDRSRVDVALVDYHLYDGDGVELCRRIKRLDTAPRVIIYSSFASPRLALPATLAGADGLIDKRAEAADLLEGIRRVNKGERLLPDVPPEVLDDASRRVAPEDRATLARLAAGGEEAAGTEDDAALPRLLEALRVEIRDDRRG
jgi:DNA-binding NarL/FixJ family response regulator